MIKDHTAGSPQQACWTDLRPKEIAARMTGLGYTVSRRIVRKLMKQNGFVLRQSQKKKAYRQHPDRNTQFE